MRLKGHENRNRLSIEARVKAELEQLADAGRINREGNGFRLHETP